MTSAVVLSTGFFSPAGEDGADPNHQRFSRKTQTIHLSH